VVIHTLADDPRYGTMSRYALAKSGRYPRTKAGNRALQLDLEAARIERRGF
jgi:hypothetical protein